MKWRIKGLLTNDIEATSLKQLLPIVTDCNEGKSIPSLHSISSNLAIQNTLLWRNSPFLFFLPYITTSEEEDLTVNSQPKSSPFNANIE